MNRLVIWWMVAGILSLGVVDLTLSQTTPVKFQYIGECYRFETVCLFLSSCRKKCVKRNFQSGQCSVDGPNCSDRQPYQCKCIPRS